MKKIILIFVILLHTIAFSQKSTMQTYEFRYMSYPTKSDSVPNIYHYEVVEKTTDIEGHPIDIMLRSINFVQIIKPPNSPSKISIISPNEVKINHNETASFINLFYGNIIGLGGATPVSMNKIGERDFCHFKLDVGLLDIVSKRYVLMDNNMIRTTNPGNYYGYAFSVFVPMNLSYKDNKDLTNYSESNSIKDTFTYYFPHHLTGQTEYVAGYSNKTQLDSYLLKHQSTFFGQMKRKYISDWLINQKDSIQTSYYTFSKLISVNSYFMKKDKAGNYKDINQAHEYFSIGIDSVKLHFKSKNYINWYNAVMQSYFQKSYDLYKTAYDEMVKHHEAEYDGRFATIKDKYYLSLATMWSAFLSGNIDQVLKPYIFAAKISADSYLKSHFKNNIFRKIPFFLYQYKVNKDKKGWEIKAE